MHLNNKPKKKKSDRLKPISLYPLKPEQVLSVFMKVDPERVRVRERKIQKKKDALSSA